MRTGLILQSMPGCMPDVEKGDFAFKSILPFWRTVVGRGSTHVIKWEKHLWEMPESVREEDSQQFTEEVVDQGGKQRVQGDLTGTSLRKSIAAVITQLCTIKPEGLWSTLVTTS